MHIKLRTTLPPALIAVCILGTAPLAWAQIATPGAFEERPAAVDRLRWHTADPDESGPFIEAELEKATRPADLEFGRNLLERINRIKRPRQVRLTLEDAVHRAVANSLVVRVQSYNPAINTARVVEAEAAFDAVFFMDLTKNLDDTPAPSELVGTSVDFFSINTGLRKPLPTGALLDTRVQLLRIETDNRFQTSPITYTSAFVATLRQPLLRNAGIDFNRARINIARNDLKLSDQAFKRQVRDTVFATEQAYWQLAAARREVTIQARLLSQLEKTYDYLDQRRNFDVYLIQLSQTRASVETSKADFIRVVNQVADAEDALLAIINDPTLNLVDELEIIPTDFPAAQPIRISPAAAVQTALENRSELVEAALTIDNAAIRVGQARNQAQPRLDMIFEYQVNGLGLNADDAFDEVTQSDFIDYMVFLDFELPVGNRERKALLRQAHLSHAQAIASLKAQIEQVILEVNTAVRAAQTAYDRIEPSLQSAEANEDQVSSVIARQERKDFAALNQELNARGALAAGRSALLNDLVQYNIAVIDLERLKGTLLEYNSIVLVDGNE